MKIGYPLRNEKIPFPILIPTLLLGLKWSRKSRPPRLLKIIPGINGTHAVAYSVISYFISSIALVFDNPEAVNW